MALTKVSTDGVKNDAITAAKIPANAIGASELADNSVDTNAIQANAITNAKIGNTEITGNKLADQAVSLDKLPHGTSSNDGKFLRANNGADPTFETVTSTTINNNADNRLITGSGTANTLEAESGLTYSSNELTVTEQITVDSPDNVTSIGGDYALKLLGGDAINDIVNLRFATGADGSLAQVSAIAEATGSYPNSSGALLLCVQSGGAVYEALRINSARKVGIGTSSPTEILHIKEGTNKNLHFTGGIGQIGNVTGFYAVNDANNAIVDIGMTGSTVRFGTTAGERGRFTSHGLCFNGDTAADNALDDYEEGGWTATCVNGGDSINNDTSNNRYVKIGSMVFLTFEVSGLSNPNNNAFEVGGIPFPVATGREGTGSCMSNHVTFGTNRTAIACYAYAGQSKLRFYTFGNATSWRAITGSDFTVSGSIIGSIAYHTV